MTTPYNPESYWDEVADQITVRTDTKLIAGDDEPYYRYKRKRFLQMLDSISFSGKNVLEVGSGPGGNLAYIAEKGAGSVTGADISSHMIELARESLKGKNASLVKINGRELPFNDKQFHLTFTSTVLQHNTDEAVLRQLISEICRVSSEEVILFERIEKTIKGHESNLGRPISYYAGLMEEHGFGLAEEKGLPIQASFYTCGAIRKLFNPSTRKEGEPLTRFSVTLERLLLPLTSILDAMIPSNRDVMMMRYVRKKKAYEGNSAA